MATVTVQHSETEPYDRCDDTTLIETRIVETFAGDIEGTSTVRARGMKRDDESPISSAFNVSSGRLAGRQAASC
jgi:hypothetical protein